MDSSDEEGRGAFVFGTVDDQIGQSDDENFILSKRARLLLDQCYNDSDDDDHFHEQQNTDQFDDDDAADEYDVLNTPTLAEDQFETDDSDASESGRGESDACTNQRAKLPVSLEHVCDNCLNRYAQMM